MFWGRFWIVSDHFRIVLLGFCGVFFPFFGVDVVIIETPGEGHVELIAPDSKSWAKQRTLILKEFGLQ